MLTHYTPVGKIVGKAPEAAQPAWLTEENWPDSEPLLTGAILDTQLGICSPGELLEARAMLALYGNWIGHKADQHIFEAVGEMKIKARLGLKLSEDEKLARISGALYEATDGIEADVTALHAAVVMERSHHSLVRSGFEHAHVIKASKAGGRIAIASFAGSASFITAGAVHHELQNKSWVVAGSLAAVGAVAAGKILVPSLARNFTQQIMGKRFEKAIKPIPEPVQEEFARLEKQHITETGEDFDHMEKLLLVRELEIAYQVKGLHKEMQSEIRDWLRNCKSEDCLEITPRLVGLVTDHIAETYGLGNFTAQR